MSKLGEHACERKSFPSYFTQTGEPNNATTFSIHRKEKHHSVHLARLQHPRHQFEVHHTLPDSDPQLMPIDQPTKWDPALLPLSGNLEQVTILSEQHTPQFS